MNTKGMLMAFASAGFLAMSPVGAQEGTGPANPLVGAWKLVDLGLTGGRGDTYRHWLGPHPTGTLICLPSGTFQLQILRDPPPVQKVPGILPLASDAVKLDAATGYEAGFGTYTVSPDGKTATFHYQAALWPNNVGKDMTVELGVGDAQLKFKSTTPEVSHSTFVINRTFTWQRLDLKPEGKAYSLVSVEVLSPDGQVDPDQGRWMGSHPTGLLIDLDAGYYALQVMGDPRPLQSSKGPLLNASKKDKLATVLGFYADYGTYTFDPDSGVATSHMLGSLWPNLQGRDLRTHPRMDGERFINTTDPIDTGKGTSLVYRWTWEAIK